MPAREYARLQGTDDFPIAVGPLQAMYGFGDAVCVPVIEWTDRNILSPLFRSQASAAAGLERVADRRERVDELARTAC